VILACTVLIGLKGVTDGQTDAPAGLSASVSSDFLYYAIIIRQYGMCKKTANATGIL